MFLAIGDAFLDSFYNNIIYYVGIKKINQDMIYHFLAYYQARTPRAHRFTSKNFPIAKEIYLIRATLNLMVWRDFLDWSFVCRVPILVEV